MCSPLMALSTAFSAVGAMSQAEAQRDALNYQSQVARNNATLAQYQAKDAVERGQAEEQNRRLRTAATFSDQRAQLAANGIDLGEGIATDLLATTKYIGEHDALTARNNAAREAWGYRAKARGFLDESAMKDATAGGINPLMAGATSLLGSAKSYGTDWFSPSAKVNPGNYQVGTRGYSGNYLEWDA